MINCEYCKKISTSTQVCTECGEPLVDNPNTDSWENGYLEHYDGEPSWLLGALGKTRRLLRLRSLRWSKRLGEQPAVTEGQKKSVYLGKNYEFGKIDELRIA